ncbi:MAG: hypothetical protein PUH69_04640, partial [Faecalibacterium prausnitzii]|nr:hypothetical protein [Faecalibacterium prausnitzii]
SITKTLEFLVGAGGFEQAQASQTEFFSREKSCFMAGFIAAGGETARGERRSLGAEVGYKVGYFSAGDSS